MQRRERNGIVAILLVLLLALVVWFVLDGDGGNPIERVATSAPDANQAAPDRVVLVEDGSSEEEAAVETQRDVPSPAVVSEPVPDAPVNAGPAELVLRVDAPRSVRSLVNDRTVQLPAWLELPTAATLGSQQRRLGHQSGGGWQFRAALDGPGSVLVVIDVPSGGRIEVELDVEPGPNRRVIDLGEQDGAPVVVSLRYDESFAVYLDTLVDLEQIDEGVVDHSEPRGWVALVDVSTDEVVARAPIGSTHRADRPDDDLEFADALFPFVAPGTYRARIEAALGPVLEIADPDASFVVADQRVDLPLALRLVDEPQNAIRPLELELVGAPRTLTVEVRSYGSWGAHGVDTSRLVESATVQARDGRVSLLPTQLNGWSAARIMVAVDGYRPVFLDAQEAYARCTAGEGPIEVDLAPGSGGVLFAGGTWGPGARGPADGLVVDVGGTWHRVEQGFVELAFDHALGFDAGGVRVPELLGGESGGHVTSRVTFEDRAVVVEIGGR